MKSSRTGISTCPPGGRSGSTEAWFWFSTRFTGAENWSPIFENARCLEPIGVPVGPGHPERGLLKGRVYKNSLRVTWRGGSGTRSRAPTSRSTWCDCPTGSRRVAAPETARDFRFPLLRQVHREWTSPVTNRLLVEAVGLASVRAMGIHASAECQRGSSPGFERLAPQMIPVTEQSTGLAIGRRRTTTPTRSCRTSPTAQQRPTSLARTASRLASDCDHGFQEDQLQPEPVGVPVQQCRAEPAHPAGDPGKFRNHQDNDLGIFAEDQWVAGEHHTEPGAPVRPFQRPAFPSRRRPGRLVPTRNLVFPAQDNLGWNDMTYRSGLVYDLLGNGKTAAKVTFNKDPLGQTLKALGTDPNPVNRHGRVRRPDPGPTRTAIACQTASIGTSLANGECRGINNPLFGTAVPSESFDDLLEDGLRQPRGQLAVLGGRAARAAPARFARRRPLPADLGELPGDRRPGAPGRERVRQLQHGGAARLEAPRVAAAIRSRGSPPEA